MLRDPEDRSAFARIWDACSVMDQHVQSQFTPDERDAIFGEEWDSVPSQDFAQVRGLLRRSAKGPDGPYPAAPTGLLAILKSAQPTGGDEDSPTADDEAGRYGFIVDFSNFLLHALKLQFDDAFSWDDETASTGRVSLDDKTLIEQFRMLRDPAAVQKFAGLLLRLRFLFDAYVIKPDRARGNADDANWVLRRAHLTGSGTNRRLSPISTFRPSGSRPDDVDAEPSGLQRRIVMAQSMFQVTDSRRSYKNFLYAILRYLQAQSESDIDGAEFLTRLHQIAEQRVLRVSESGLNGGTRVAHFVFNFLDYAWWLRFESGVERPPDRVDVDGFRFRYRTSVEHFYPQHPETTEGHNPLEPAVLDALGNLCIMTRSDNSRRSNLMPMAKIAEYDSTQQSLKFQLMAAAAEEAGAWGDEQIRTHGDHARDCLRGSLFRLVNWPG